MGPVAYKLKLPMELSRIHNVFHVLMLRKYAPNSLHILQKQPLEVKTTWLMKKDSCVC